MAFNLPLYGCFLQRLACCAVSRRPGDNSVLYGDTSVKEFRYGQALGKVNHIIVIVWQLTKRGTLSPAMSNQKSQRPARADSINILMVSGSLSCFTFLRENSEEVFQGK